MYQQVYDPVGDSLGLTAIFAALPLLTLFILLGGLKRKAHEAAIASLLVALVIAIAVYSMPFGQAVDGALLGAVFGLFPIMWIVWNALWIYNMTEATGHFAVLRRSFGGSRTTSACRPSSSPSASARCSRRSPASARRWPSPP